MKHEHEVSKEFLAKFLKSVENIPLEQGSNYKKESSKLVEDKQEVKRVIKKERGIPSVRDMPPAGSKFGDIWD